MARAQAQTIPNLSPTPVVQDLGSPDNALHGLAVRLADSATATRDITIAGHAAQFQPVHVDADPFAQGLGRLQTNVWLGHLESDSTRFKGNWKIQTGFEAGVQIRHTFGSKPDNRNDYILAPNFAGARIEGYQRILYPLDDAARRDDAASRAAGQDLAPQAYSWNGNWLMRAVSGSTHFFVQGVEGTEIHTSGDPVRPYVRAMAGISRGIPFGNNRGIDLRIGEELRTSLHGARVMPYVEASYHLNF
jgi:hypothetical protein